MLVRQQLRCRLRACCLVLAGLVAFLCCRANLELRAAAMVFGLRHPPLSQLYRVGNNRRLNHIATAASPVIEANFQQIEFVKLGANDEISAYVVGPSDAPAVIVIQEWWGVTDQVKYHAAKIAAEGYRCLIPDLYKGKVGVDVEEAQHHSGNLDFPGAIGEIAQAAEWLKETGSPKVGVTGFCMGGALTLGSLAASPVLVCGAPFYGCNFQLFDPQTLKKPVEGHFGMLDTMEGFSDKATGKKLQADLKAAGNKDVKVWFYPKVGHAFMNTDPSPFASFEEREAAMGFPPYNADTAGHAWARLLRFFKKHIGPGQVAYTGEGQGDSVAV